jgi:hypothetical protein
LQGEHAEQRRVMLQVVCAKAQSFHYLLQVGVTALISVPVPSPNVPLNLFLLLALLVYWSKASLRMVVGAFRAAMWLTRRHVQIWARLYTNAGCAGHSSSLQSAWRKEVPSKMKEIVVVGVFVL